MIDRRFTALCIATAFVAVGLLSGAFYISVVDDRDKVACDDAGGVYYESLCMDPEALIDVGGRIDPNVYVDMDPS